MFGKWMVKRLPLLLLASLACGRAAEFGELTNLARGKTDKVDTHGFTEIYEHLFFALRSAPIRICEIGIAGGGSLHVWSKYFNHATVFGIDIHTLDELRSLLRQQGMTEEFLPTQPESERIKTFVADQANREQLKNFIAKYGGGFDIVLDDGGHTMEQQQVSFGFFFRHLKPGGYYVIEDVHTSLTDRYEGFGAQKNEGNTTLRMINSFIRTGQIESAYLQPDEVQYLNQQIEYCNLFYRNNNARSITCIFKKKS
ncbi:MAG: class I SAM-dependent methyltransferase [Acidobacteria bacterium]|nr:class I SAM-dependent methyltransferase [Acidobacteriota bacterium]